MSQTLRGPAASRWWRAALAWLVALAGSLAAAQQPAPPLTGQVVDQAHALDATQVAALTQQLAALEQRTGAQVAVLTVDSTAPEDIADFTQRVADEWKLGRADVGDGVLVVVAVKDRRARIAVAKSLEGAIPDLEARRIITQAMAPKFQDGRYAEGLQAGIDRLAALIQHEALPSPAPTAAPGDATGDGDGAPWWMAALMGLVVLSSVLRAVLGRRGAAALTGGAAGVLTVLATGSWLLAIGAALAGFVLALAFGAASLLHGLAGRGARGPVILGGGWPGGGGGWGGGGGGGGWRSGGGGDFGGGGASGNW